MVILIAIYKDHKRRDASVCAKRDNWHRLRPGERDTHSHTDACAGEDPSDCLQGQLPLSHLRPGDPSMQSANPAASLHYWPRGAMPETTTKGCNRLVQCQLNTPISPTHHTTPNVQTRIYISGLGWPWRLAAVCALFSST